MLEAHADAQVCFSVGRLDSSGSRPVRVREVAEEEDSCEDGKNEDHWEDVAHRSLLLFEP